MEEVVVDPDELLVVLLVTVILGIILGAAYTYYGERGFMTASFIIGMAALILALIGHYRG